MKKATHTPNRFIISTQSWLAKGLALFLLLILINACEDELSDIGSKKPTSRFKVVYHEFDIPATTIQSDSIKSNISPNESTRLLLGGAEDPNFGIVNTETYVQFSPSLYTTPKVDQTSKTNFLPTSLTVSLLLDYFVYGDTTDATLKFTLHRIKDESDFFWNKTYYTSSSIEESDYETNAFATAEFNYKQTDIVAHRKLYNNSIATDNINDTIKFQLPIDDGYAQELVDSLKAKGVYAMNANTNVFELNALLTDSVFRKAFRGFVIKADPTNKRVLGIRATASAISLKYSYVNNGNTVKSIYYYTLRYPTFSGITQSRANTALNGLDLADAYTDFNAPDDYAYLQAGTGIYTKLDLSAVHDYFDATPDTLKNVAINSAELIVDAEPDATRHHLSLPTNLYLRLLETDNKFKTVPIIEKTGYYDNNYAGVYYCTTNSEHLNILYDNPSAGAATLTYKKETGTNRQLYSAYLSEFFENFLRTPKDFSKIKYISIYPADGPFGRSFYGLSFKKDKVKLRITYTKAL